MVHVTRNARDVMAVLFTLPPEAWLHAQEVADRLPGLTRNSVRKILIGLEGKQLAQSHEELPARMKARSAGGQPRRYYRLTERGRREAQAAMNATSRLPAPGTSISEGSPALVDAGQAEQLGRLVRAVWVSCAEMLDNPKPSWLDPWEKLDDFQRLVDTRIGVELYRRGWAAAGREILTLQRELEQVRAEARADRAAYGQAQTAIRALQKEVDRLKAVIELVGGTPDDGNDQSLEQSAQQHQHHDGS